MLSTLLALLAAPLLALASGPGGPAGVACDYPDFSSTEGLQVVGSAAQEGSVLRLTADEPELAGGVWCLAKPYLAGGFDTTFSFRITPGGLASEWGDGLAFVIQNESPLTYGETDGGIGYAQIGNSFALEIDTHLDEERSDTDGMHIAAISSGIYPNSADHRDSLGESSLSASLADSAVHTLRVLYNPGSMDIFLDGVRSRILNVAVNLDTLLSLDSGAAWVGFTAATGSAAETHEILSWAFTSTCALSCSAEVPGTVALGPPTAFSGTASSGGCDGTVLFHWDFGDGATSEEVSASHAYGAPGSYPWSLTVRAEDRVCARAGTLLVVALPGDCNGDGMVLIGEVQKAINMFLGTQAAGCGADCNGNGQASIGELQKVINAFLGFASSC